MVFPAGKSGMRVNDTPRDNLTFWDGKLVRVVQRGIWLTLLEYVNMFSGLHRRDRQFHVKTFELENQNSLSDK